MDYKHEIKLSIDECDYEQLRNAVCALTGSLSVSQADMVRMQSLYYCSSSPESNVLCFP